MANAHQESAQDHNTVAVLVVEDESLIRMEAVDMVEEAGFKAYEAGDADTAMRMLEAHGDIRVLFTDIDMPGSMNGLELATVVRQRWPNVALLITSGHVRIRLHDIPESGYFFTKPYRASDIAEKITQLATRQNELCKV